MSPPVGGASIPPGALRLGAAAALRLARASRGMTAPNPPVGCAAFDRQGRLLAVARHDGPGQAHAEAAALEACRRSGDLAAVHTLFVTLEPCNHHGRTPPCAEAVIGAQVTEVVIGACDPNPAVRGGGAARLAMAGVRVRHLSAFMEPDIKALGPECEALIAPFAKHAVHGLPWVLVKQALDLSGSMIPPLGSKTFTDPESIRLAHRLRRESDAIITGVGTVLADQPLFTVRAVDDFEGKIRWLGILDRTGRTPAAYLTAARKRGVEPICGSDFTAMVRDLGRRGALQVLVEAGPTISEHVLESGFWDEHVVIRRSAAGDVVERRRRKEH